MSKSQMKMIATGLVISFAAIYLVNRFAPLQRIVRGGA